jgi:hypothetical protein
MLNEGYYVKAPKEVFHQKKIKFLKHDTPNLRLKWVETLITLKLLS